MFDAVKIVRIVIFSSFAGFFFVKVKKITDFIIF